MNSLFRHRRNKQKGAALVEMAIIIMLFMFLIFGVIEFTMMVYAWSRVVEATRAGVRYAIVHTPPVNAATFETFRAGCPGSDDIVVQCDESSSGECGEIYSLVNRFLPGPMTNNSYQVEVVYSCSDAGYSGRELKIPTVSVGIVGLQYRTFLPNLLGIDAQFNILPEYKATRTGEDLETVGSGS